MLVYDCSNSPERPATRGYGGAVENACVTMLKRYATRYMTRFVDDPQIADVIFTNDVYPSDILRLNKCRIKRMDGIYWQTQLRDRNVKLNAAAEQSDCVIFVSEFSRQSLHRLYGIQGRHQVIRNAADQQIFQPARHRHERPRVWMAACTHWGRSEKRLGDTLRLASMLPPFATLFLVGTMPDIQLPKNVKSVGYVRSAIEWGAILNEADVFVNLSYRDAAPKVVMEAVCCGLPVLYADSGGTRELCGDCGVGIQDAANTGFMDHVPRLAEKALERGVREMLESYPFLIRTVVKSNFGADMLRAYFKAFRSIYLDRASQVANIPS